jgi:hypothetical protein
VVQEYFSFILGLHASVGDIAHLIAVVAQSKNCPFGVNTKIELKNIKTMPHKNRIWQGMFQLRSVPVLSDVAVTSFSSIIALNLNGSFWILPLLHSVSDIFAAYQTVHFVVLSVAIKLLSVACSLT